MVEGLTTPHRKKRDCYETFTKIFGANKDEITGEWRKLHNAELHALYSSPNIIRSLKSRVFVNKVLRKIFGANKDEITGEWRKLHNAELHALYSSPNIIRNLKSRQMRWAGHVASMEQFRNAYRVSMGKPESETFREAETQMRG